jgi:hypothetical protein
MTKTERLYYIACGVILAAWAIFYCWWLMFSTYPAILAP